MNEQTKHITQTTPINNLIRIDIIIKTNTDTEHKHNQQAYVIRVNNRTINTE